MRRSCAWKELTKTCTMPRHARDLLMIRTRVAGALGARKQAREKRFPDACRSPRFEFSFPRHPLFFSGRAPAGFSLAFLTLNSDTVFSLPSLSPRPSFPPLLLALFFSQQRQQQHHKMRKSALSFTFLALALVAGTRALPTVSSFREWSRVRREICPTLHPKP